MKIVTVVGARPQFVKAAIFSKIIKEKKYQEKITEVLIHTGQHYDQLLSDVFFKELGIPIPKYNLNIGSHRTCIQLSQLISKLEPVIVKENPKAILIYGDTNSTLAAALVGAHLGIPVIHVEAGERIYRRKDVPEEINRVMTDHVASLCLTSTKRATNYLKREGMASDRVAYVGDIMYDLFIWGKQNISNMNTNTYDSLKLAPGSYHLATIHRAQNTDHIETLLGLLKTLDNSDIPVILPLHPRVKNILTNHTYTPSKNLKLIEALGYFDFLKALLNCNKVVTDSGGVTREAFFAKKPCIIPMENSWWTEVVESGWAQVVSHDFDLLDDKLNHFDPPDNYPEDLFGDGQSAKHILNNIDAFIKNNNAKNHWHPHGYFDQLPKNKSSTFSYHHYIKMLNDLKQQGYHFTMFDRYKDALNQKEPFVLLRHDIDMSLEAALDMAKIEYKHHVASTYFLMIRNDFYNIFSEKNTKIVKEILSFGHQIGLHFDCAAYFQNLTKKDLALACAKEVTLMETWFKCPIKVISYHRPSELILSGDDAISAPLLHTYSKQLNKHVHYVSDSRGEWKYGHPTQLDAFKHKKPLQILVHPIWWKKNPIGPYENLMHFVDQKKTSIENNLKKNCEVFRAGSLWMDDH